MGKHQIEPSRVYIIYLNSPDQHSFHISDALARGVHTISINNSNHDFMKSLANAVLGMTSSIGTITFDIAIEYPDVTSWWDLGDWGHAGNYKENFDVWLPMLQEMILEISPELYIYSLDFESE